MQKIVEGNENNRAQKYPPLGGSGFNPGSINSVITICDYDKEKEKHDDKDTQPIF